MKAFTGLVLACLAFSAIPAVYAETKTGEELKSRYVYTDLTKDASGNNSHVMMLRKGQDDSSLDKQADKIELPASCIVSTKQFVNCRR